MPRIPSIKKQLSLKGLVECEQHISISRRMLVRVPDNSHFGSHLETVYAMPKGIDEEYETMMNEPAWVDCEPHNLLIGNHYPTPTDDQIAQVARDFKWESMARDW